MTYFSCTVRATSNSSANTEDTFIDLDAASNAIVKLVRIRVVPTATTAADNTIRVKIARKSAIGSGSTGGTEISLNGAHTAAAATVATIKNGTSTYGAGTITDTIDDAINFNQRGTWEWIARDDNEKISTSAGGIIGVNCFASAASQTLAVYVVWEE